jgi:hypothetical protein
MPSIAWHAPTATHDQHATTISNWQSLERCLVGLAGGTLFSANEQMLDALCSRSKVRPCRGHVHTEFGRQDKGGAFGPLGRSRASTAGMHGGYDVYHSFFGGDIFFGCRTTRYCTASSHVSASPSSLRCPVQNPSRRQSAAALRMADHLAQMPVTSGVSLCSRTELSQLALTRSNNDEPTVFLRLATRAAA